MEISVNEKILDFVRLRGPCLPVHISKYLKISLIFSGAYLSQLSSEKEIKISNMKVGGSPLYYIPGQEQMLEKSYTYLPGKEREAFLLLKEKFILKDDEQEPAIRFALRQIRDFAFPLQFQEKLFWRFHSFLEQDALNKIKEAGIEKEVKKESKLEEEKKDEEKKLEEREEEKKEKKHEEHEKPLIKLKKIEEKKVGENKEKESLEKPLIRIKKTEEKKEKEKSVFVLTAIDFLNREDIEILQEIEFKKKEYIAKVRINSDLGKMEFLCLAKDKKSITDIDLTIAMKTAQDFKLPALVISKADLNKKGNNYIQAWGNLVKFKRIPAV